MFTDIQIPADYFGIFCAARSLSIPTCCFSSACRKGGALKREEFLYRNGIADYVRELAGDDAMTDVQVWTAERQGRDRADKPEYRVKLNVAMCVSNSTICWNTITIPVGWNTAVRRKKAVRSAFVSQIDAYLKQNGKYLKNESKISFQDVAGLPDPGFLLLFHPDLLREPDQKAITNRFIQEAMTEFLRHNLEVYFLENKAEADRFCDQVLVNKRSREKAETTRLNLKKDPAVGKRSHLPCSKLCGLPQPRRIPERSSSSWRKSAMGACIQARNPGLSGDYPGTR